MATAIFVGGHPSGAPPPPQNGRDAVLLYCPQIVAPKRSRIGPIGEAIAVPFEPPPIRIPTGWKTPSSVTISDPESPKAPKLLLVRIWPTNKAVPEGNVIFTL